MDAVDLVDEVDGCLFWSVYQVHAVHEVHWAPSEDHSANAKILEKDLPWPAGLLK